ncbi:hypothetical protein [Cellulomonas aerilata]|uniref:Uncharacterized protein n=1 Tax=Cellulomonas aerilata TaxID=515326 RepID=A0A512DAH5_9CELL|nr:hypothetical protein [Cellulomonas aerilata]GEO33481.1 hypothetical protein CAE01nite_12060 [Cellulomonas aerilata]
MATIEHGRQDGGPTGGWASSPGPTTATDPATVTGGAGDLEFDEAWGDAAAATDTRADPETRDPHPAFEDPNDR